MPSDTVLIGYLPKHIVDATENVDAWWRFPGVEEICSVSECFLQGTARLGRLLAAQPRHLAVRQPGGGLVGGAGGRT